MTVQIGATVSHWIGRRLPFRNPDNTFLLIGMGAGFAGLFIVCVVAYLINMDKSIYALQERA